MAAKNDVNPTNPSVDPSTIPLPEAKGDGNVTPAEERGLNFTSEPGEADGFSWGLQPDWVKAHDGSFQSGKTAKKKGQIRRPVMILPAALLAILMAAIVFGTTVGNKPIDGSEGQLPLIVEFCKVLPLLCSPGPDAVSPPDNSSPEVPTFLGCWEECDPDSSICGAGLSCVPNYNNGGNGYVCGGIQCATPTPTTTPNPQNPPVSDPGTGGSDGSVNVDLPEDVTTGGSKDGSGKDDTQTDAGASTGGGSVPQPPTITATPAGVCDGHGGLSYSGTTCVCPGFIDEVVICGDGTKTDQVTDQTCTPTESCVSSDGGSTTGGQPPACTCDFVCTKYGAAGCAEGGYVNSCTGAVCTP